MNSSLSGNSELTVWPYSLRPSDWKKRHVSIASCTSPPLSFKVFPISLVSTLTISSLYCISSLPIFPIICPLVGAGVADQEGNAFLAAFRASCTSSLFDSGNSPRQSESNAGLRLSKVSPPLDNFNSPLIMLYPLTFGLPLGLSDSIKSNPVSSTLVMFFRNTTLSRNLLKEIMVN